MRLLFHNLVDKASIKIGESGLWKTFDLMIMGFKMQCLQVTVPEEILHITLRHLAQVEELVGGDSAAARKIWKTKKQVSDLASTLGPYQFICIKQSLFNFFEDRQIKVDQWVEEGAQAPDG